MAAGGGEFMVFIKMAKFFFFFFSFGILLGVYSRLQWW